MPYKESQSDIANVADIIIDTGDIYTLYEELYDTALRISLTTTL